MGYELHITRADDWSESEAKPITFAEWVACVNSDPEMRLHRVAEATTPTGETLRYENEGLAVWTAYSGHGIDGNMAWFDHRDGRIVVKNPDEEIRRKMYAIAMKLAAHVQGDEGEQYGESGNEARLARPAPPKPHGPQPWWKGILGLFRRGHTVLPGGEATQNFAAAFKCGDRIKDPWANRGTVLEVDPTGERGLGRMRVRFDDGREVTVAMVASGLELLTDTKQTID